MAFITITTLKRYKDEQALIELYGTGVAGSRVIDTANLTLLISDISESIQDELTDIYTVDEADVPALIEEITAQFVLYALYGRQHGGISESEEKAYKVARQKLDDIKSGKTKLSTIQQLEVGDGETIQVHEDESFDEDILS